VTLTAAQQALNPSAPGSTAAQPCIEIDLTFSQKGVACQFASPPVAISIGAAVGIAIAVLVAAIIASVLSKKAYDSYMLSKQKQLGTVMTSELYQQSNNTFKNPLS